LHAASGAEPEGNAFRGAIESKAVHSSVRRDSQLVSVHRACTPVAPYFAVLITPLMSNVPTKGPNKIVERIVSEPVAPANRPHPATTVMGP
jgi:hypothetical protein